MRVMFLMDWDHFEDFVKFPLHDTSTEAMSPEADEADPAMCGDDYSAGAGAEAMKTTRDNKQGKEEITLYPKRSNDISFIGGNNFP